MIQPCKLAKIHQNCTINQDESKKQHTVLLSFSCNAGPGLNNETRLINETRPNRIQQVQARLNNETWLNNETGLISKKHGTHQKR